MFNKAENLKHYKKIADGIAQVNPSYEVTILRKTHFDDQRELLTIRACLTENRMSEFWIEDGYWVAAHGGYRDGEWKIFGSREPLDNLGMTLDFMLPATDENKLPLFPQYTNWRDVVNAMFGVNSLLTRESEAEIKAKGML